MSDQVLVTCLVSYMQISRTIDTSLLSSTITIMNIMLFYHPTQSRNNQKPIQAYTDITATRYAYYYYYATLQFSIQRGNYCVMQPSVRDNNPMLGSSSVFDMPQAQLSMWGCDYILSENERRFQVYCSGCRGHPDAFQSDKHSSNICQVEACL